MPNNNPEGVNAFGGWEMQPVHGAVKQLHELTQAAPLAGSGQAAHATDSPRRAQRRAVRGQPAPQAAQAAPPQQPELPYPILLAQVWQEIAADPGADELIHRYAEQAQQAAHG